MKAVVAAFNQEKALLGAFSVIVETDCKTDGALHSTTQHAAAAAARRCTHPDTQTENFATQSCGETGEAAAAVQRVQTLHTRLPPLRHYISVHRYREKVPTKLREGAYWCLLLVL